MRRSHFFERMLQDHQIIARGYSYLSFLAAAGIHTVLAFEDVGIKLEASVKIGLDGIKIKIDQEGVGRTELLKHVLKRSKQAMQMPHDFGFMWFWDVLSRICREGSKLILRSCFPGPGKTISDPLEFHKPNMLSFLFLGVSSDRFIQFNAVSGENMRRFSWISYQISFYRAVILNPQP